MGHLIEKKYQVIGHYFCMQFFWYVQNYIFGNCAMAD